MSDAFAGAFDHLVGLSEESGDAFAYIVVEDAVEAVVVGGLEASVNEPQVGRVGVLGDEVGTWGLGVGIVGVDHEVDAADDVLQAAALNKGAEVVENAGNVVNFQAELDFYAVGIFRFERPNFVAVGEIFVVLDGEGVLERHGGMAAETEVCEPMGYGVFHIFAQLAFAVAVMGMGVVVGHCWICCRSHLKGVDGAEYESCVGHGFVGLCVAVGVAVDGAFHTIQCLCVFHFEMEAEAVACHVGDAGLDSGEAADVDAASVGSVGVVECGSEVVVCGIAEEDAGTPVSRGAAEVGPDLATVSLMSKSALKLRIPFSVLTEIVHVSVAPDILAACPNAFKIRYSILIPSFNCLPVTVAV